MMLTCRLGLSPRVRGNHWLTNVRCTSLGSIPACAGEPFSPISARYGSGVYPRVCGGTTRPSWLNTVSRGLSPRVRGNHNLAQLGWLWPRSIPACAGEPSSGELVSSQYGVYPRVCGGTAALRRWLMPLRGLSPRVRGNPRRLGLMCGPRRSIPACAGEPDTTASHVPRRTVYPRVCGGTRHICHPAIFSPGLSPRVRGNRSCSAPLASGRGSIPACAGEPEGENDPVGIHRVYPRVCGGTRFSHAIDPLSKGLSPRVRGNRPYRVSSSPVRRSIPACAGEPLISGTKVPVRKVYPRVCGGTTWIQRPNSEMTGLSPRVRGNLVNLTTRSDMLRSIPACAGEPALEPPTRRNPRVYPRVCGGTMHLRHQASSRKGLSPRVRGNLAMDEGAWVKFRSIPACAGEPDNVDNSKPPQAVYPRVCGGTTPPLLTRSSCSGLSPRVRGNPGLGRGTLQGLRSIPACAGEPILDELGELEEWVYPRVCGGTSLDVIAQAGIQGLSPRVRGNHWLSPAWSLRSRSIPACAGEPSGAQR